MWTWCVFQLYFGYSGVQAYAHLTDVQEAVYVSKVIFYQNNLRKVFIINLRRDRKRSLNLGPPMCLGWNWTLKNGRFSCTIPSFILSLVFMKRVDQSAGRVSESTAKLWFCVVMKQRWEVECMHGWLWPRLPYLHGEWGEAEGGRRRRRGGSGLREGWRGR